MPTAHLFSYNLSSNGVITGCTQYGNMAVSLNTTTNVGFIVSNMGNPYHGPDEDLGYVIAYESSASTRTHKRGTEVAPNAIGFLRSSSRTDSSFVSLVNGRFNQSYSLDSTGAADAKAWLNSNGYWTNWSQLLFDVFSSFSVTPSAAFSFRKLNNNYTGACCRIRRESDSQETDINFVNDIVDTASIQSFANGSIASIVRIYDQSGNGKHRVQSIAIRQPHIKNAANVIYTQNGKPAVNFNNSFHMLQHTTTILPANANYSAFNVYRNTQPGPSLLFVAGTNQYAFVADNGDPGTDAYGQASSTLNKVNNSSVTIDYRDEAYAALSDKPAPIAHYSDFNLTSTWGGNFWFGGYGLLGGGFDWYGYYMEEIYCDGSQVSNSALSAAVYANQQNYYSL